MSSFNQTQYLQERLAKALAILEALDDAMLAFATNPTQEYWLDSGQGRVRKTLADLEQLRISRQSAENEVQQLQSKLYGCGSAQWIPGF